MVIRENRNVKSDVAQILIWRGLSPPRHMGPRLLKRLMERRCTVPPQRTTKLEWRRKVSNPTESNEYGITQIHLWQWQQNKSMAYSLLNGNIWFLEAAVKHNAWSSCFAALFNQMDGNLLIFFTTEAAACCWSCDLKGLSFHSFSSQPCMKFFFKTFCTACFGTLHHS